MHDILTSSANMSQYELSVDFTSNDVHMTPTNSTQNHISLSSISPCVLQESCSNSENVDPSMSSGSRNKYFREYRNFKRKEQRLESIIKSFTSPVKTKVAAKTLKAKPIVLNDIFASTNEAQDKNNSVTSEAVITFLKKLNKEKKYRKFYKNFRLMFANLEGDDQFMT